VPFAGNDAVSGDSAIDVSVGAGGGAGVAGLLLPPPHDATTNADSSPKQLRTTFPFINDISLLPEGPASSAIQILRSAHFRAE
jgi:hypothetical protein